VLTHQAGHRLGDLFSPPIADSQVDVEA
jgi:hypothetical protein